MFNIKQFILSVMLILCCIMLIGCKKDLSANAASAGKEQTNATNINESSISDDTDIPNESDTFDDTGLSNESDAFNDTDLTSESDTFNNTNISGESDTFNDANIPSESNISNDSDAASLNSDLLLWLKETTSIPVYLPAVWTPIRQETKQTYYLQAMGDEKSYGVNVYRTKTAVKFNDSEDLLEKNGPVSEADFIGSIVGEFYNPDSFTYDIPEDAESFELAPDITAYKANDGTAVWWEKNGWKFSFVGSTAFTDTLKDLASTWPHSNMDFSKTGYVTIVGGNKLTFSFKWEKGGYQYNFTSGETDFNEVVNILNSFSAVTPD